VALALDNEMTADLGLGARGRFTKSRRGASPPHLSGFFPVAGFIEAAIRAFTVGAFCLS
jgi:hypothetical protein